MKTSDGRVLTMDEMGMVVKGLDTESKMVQRAADSRKYAGPDFSERRANLRRLARRYTALARELERDLL
jgi:hypothetical protein